MVPHAVVLVTLLLQPIAVLAIDPPPADAAPPAAKQPLSVDAFENLINSVGELVTDHEHHNSTHLQGKPVVEDEYKQMDSDTHGNVTEVQEHMSLMLHTLKAVHEFALALSDKQDQMESTAEENYAHYDKNMHALADMIATLTKSTELVFNRVVDLEEHSRNVTHDAEVARIIAQEDYDKIEKRIAKVEEASPRSVGLQEMSAWKEDSKSKLEQHTRELQELHKVVRAEVAGFKQSLKEEVKPVSQSVRDLQRDHVRVQGQHKDELSQLREKLAAMDAKLEQSPSISFTTMLLSQLVFTSLAAAIHTTYIRNTNKRVHLL